jgi:hypothetical protein
MIHVDNALSSTFNGEAQFLAHIYPSTDTSQKLATMAFLNSSRVVRFLPYTLFLIYPQSHMKKSGCVKSGLCGGQEIRPPR